MRHALEQWFCGASRPLHDAHALAMQAPRQQDSLQVQSQH
jgi:hypothetical protein